MLLRLQLLPPRRLGIPPAAHAPEFLQATEEDKETGRHGDTANEEDFRPLALSPSRPLTFTEGTDARPTPTTR